MVIVGSVARHILFYLILFCPFFIILILGFIGEVFLEQAFEMFKYYSSYFLPLVLIKCGTEDIRLALWTVFAFDYDYSL